MTGTEERKAETEAGKERRSNIGNVRIEIDAGAEVVRGTEEETETGVLVMIETENMGVIVTEKGTGTVTEGLDNVVRQNVEFLYSWSV